MYGVKVLTMILYSVINHDANEEIDLSITIVSTLISNSLLKLMTVNARATSCQVSMGSPEPFFPSVSFSLGMTLSEKSTCLTPWCMLDELIMSISSQT